MFYNYKKNISLFKMTSEKQEKIEEQLRPLYAELQKYGQTQDWDRALKVTRKSIVKKSISFEIVGFVFFGIFSIGYFK